MYLSLIDSYNELGSSLTLTETICFTLLLQPERTRGQICKWDRSLDRYLSVRLKSRFFASGLVRQRMLDFQIQPRLPELQQTSETLSECAHLRLAHLYGNLFINLFKNEIYNYKWTYSFLTAFYLTFNQKSLKEIIQTWRHLARLLKPLQTNEAYSEWAHPRVAHFHGNLFMNLFKNSIITIK